MMSRFRDANASKKLQPHAAKKKQPEGKFKVDKDWVSKWGEGYRSGRVIPNDTERALRDIPVREEPSSVERRKA